MKRVKPSLQSRVRRRDLLVLIRTDQARIHKVVQTLTFCMFFTCLKTGRVRPIYDYFTDAVLRIRKIKEQIISTLKKYQM
jgi:hypothetical protein